MATVTKRGKANIEGVVGTFDVIVYPISQSLKMTQNADEEIVQNERGFDWAWLIRNENGTLDIGMKFLGDTAAHAAAPVSDASKSSLGQPFLKPLTTVTLSGFEFPALNGAYQNLPSADVDMGNTKVADGNYKLRRYADAEQATLSVTTPS